MLAEAGEVRVKETAYFYMMSEHQIISRAVSREMIFSSSDTFVNDIKKKTNVLVDSSREGQSPMFEFIAKWSKAWKGGL